VTGACQIVIGHRVNDVLTEPKFASRELFELKKFNFFNKNPKTTSFSPKKNLSDKFRRNFP
jgi:UDP-N-acetylglucosamine pyrophosphorylase